MSRTVYCQRLEKDAEGLDGAGAVIIMMQT